jgi:hypothetical protein
VHQLLTLKPPKSLPNSEQPQRSDPRLLEIHAGILLGSDALESGIHEHRERGAAWNGAKLRHFWDGFGVGFFTGSGSGFEKDFLANGTHFFEDGFELLVGSDSLFQKVGLFLRES